MGAGALMPVPLVRCRFWVARVAGERGRRRRGSPRAGARRSLRRRRRRARGRSPSGECPGRTGAVTEAARIVSIGVSVGEGPSSAAPRRASWSVEATFTSSRSPPTFAFSSAGVPGGDDPAVVEHDDPVGELVGLLEVLRREHEGRAAGDELAHQVPELAAGGRVEAGRRLVEEEHRRRGDEAGGEVEPPAHAARVGLDQASAGVGRGRGARAAPRRARGRWPAAGGRGARSSRGWRAPSAGRRRSRSARRRRSARAPRRGWRPRRTRRRCRCPRSAPRGWSECRIAVVLPAPLWPSRPRTVPAGTSRSRSRSAQRSP